MIEKVEKDAPIMGMAWHDEWRHAHDNYFLNKDPRFMESLEYSYNMNSTKFSTFIITLSNPIFPISLMHMRLLRVQG